MKITIHRGTYQIGGSIAEIATDDCRIFIDLGSNLPGTGQEDFTRRQIEELTGDADAVFYTHYHGDHVGLLSLVPAHVPQYIGRGAKEVMLCKYKKREQTDEMKNIVEAVKRMQTYTAGSRIDVSGKGKVFVTPYFVSHSAFDAHLFKIECEGKTIVHTGDFRGHGYLSKGLPHVCAKLTGADLLIIEGTMLGRKQEQVLSERDIKENIRHFLREHKYVFALCSSTDMERLASMHQACKETGRAFWVDKYQKEVLDIFTKYAGKASPLFCFNKVFEFTNYATENVKNKMQSQGFLMLIRTSHKKQIQSMLKVYTDEPAWLIYSMWRGYAETGKSYSNDEIISIRSLFGNKIQDGTRDGFHTSGHADVETLRQVCSLLNPRLGVIPTHKEKDTYFEQIPGIRIFTEEYTQIENVQISLR